MPVFLFAAGFFRGMGAFLHCLRSLYPNPAGNGTRNFKAGDTIKKNQAPPLCFIWKKEVPNS